MLAFITGSGLYSIADFEPFGVQTPFGESHLLRGAIGGNEIIVLPRHGNGHAMLPNHIDHRSNLWALKDSGATAIISMTVCGTLKKDINLATPIVVEDVFFPENRLPTGQICTMYDEPGRADRGHLIAGSMMHAELQKDLLVAAPGAIQGKTYVHANGPRFNTKSEIKYMAQQGDILSQTCGPEAILANELELAYALLAFPIDYANGVNTAPTGMDELSANLAKSKEIFEQTIHNLTAKHQEYAFSNFVYRFE